MGSDKLYLQHISESIAKIESFVKELDLEKFGENEMVKSAVLRELGVIGESVKKLSKEFKNNHGNIPWKQIAGMRDKLIHDYFEIDIVAVWTATKEDLPPLKKEVESSLKDFS